ncbi:hypothetical protein PMAYCL1PPCAC_24093 [Pristionchus mayeri]|uniref:Phosphoenolpyruvate carboxykinase C-terminal P-loop domain-containing protein n=1 Tax=Pristionchus mayeri TaxID=1317129 RepID=A0AAN5CZJ2_9BILA|nr:hypothetical protein PMAYCL1PPCAC_24093 [Pristionchus mayeri]
MSMRTVKGTGIDHEQLIFNPLGMSTYYAFGLNEYLKQWFDMEKEGRTMPKIFHLNLFRRPSTGSSTPSTLSPAASMSTSSTSLDIKSDKSTIFDTPVTPQAENKQAPKDFKTVWPGFGDNIRLLAWIHGRVLKKESAVGKGFPLGTTVPATERLKGLKDVDWETCIEYDGKGWKSEVREATKKIKSISLFEKEQKFLLSFLSKKRGIIKESLGENKDQMSEEPTKEEKKEAANIQSTVASKEAIKSVTKPEQKEEPKREPKGEPKPEPKGIVKMETSRDSKDEPKVGLKEESKEGKVESKTEKKEEEKEEGKEEKKEEHKEEVKEESKEEGKEGEHKDGEQSIGHLSLQKSGNFLI